MMGLLVIGGALVVAGLAATTYVALASGGGSLGGWFRAYELRLERHTGFLRLGCRGVHVARVQAIVGCVCIAMLLITTNTAFAILFLLVVVLPPLLLWKRHVARVALLERQLDGWLVMLANALKATSSVSEAISSTAALLPRPFSEEVDLLVKEIRLGVPLGRALGTVSQRIGSHVVSGALMMIVVARRTGGNLSDTLERAAAALRETARLEGVLRTKTAEGRGQVLVLALVPFLLCLVIAWLDRSWFDPMLHHPYGRGVLAACGITWTCATVWAHHIVGTEL